MNIVIVDDEHLARQRLIKMVSQIDDCEVVAEAANGQDALKACEQHQPDLVLMDIRMPGMDGMEAAKNLLRMNPRPAVVFVTAYGDYALEAFEASAVDYLLKPVRAERLEEAVQKAQRFAEVPDDGLNKLVDSSDARRHILCRVRGSLELIPVKEILYFRADQKYVTIKAADGEMLIEESLKTLEQEFEDRFVRIHRNALVAKNEVLSIEKREDGQMMLKLKSCDHLLEVSRRHVPAVRALMKSIGDA